MRLKTRSTCVLAALTVYGLLLAAEARGQTLAPSFPPTFSLGLLQRATSAEAPDCEEIWKKGFRPVRNIYQAQCFFGSDRLSYLQQVRLTGDGKEATLLADLVSTIPGPFRIAFGAVVTASEDDDGTGTPQTNDKALETFFAGGGNAYLNLAYPLFQGGHPTKTMGQFTLFALPRVGFELPGLGTEIEDPTANFDLALEAHFWGLRADDPLQFFLQVRAGYVVGTDDFYTSLGLPDDAFAFGQVAAGFVVNNTFTISYVDDLFAPSELASRLPGRLSVQIRPRLASEVDTHTLTVQLLNSKDDDYVKMPATNLKCEHPKLICPWTLLARTTASLKSNRDAGFDCDPSQTQSTEAVVRMDKDKICKVSF